MSELLDAPFVEKPQLPNAPFVNDIPQDMNTGLTPGIANDLIYALPDYAKGLNVSAATAFKGASLAVGAFPAIIDKAFGTRLADRWFSATTEPLSNIIAKHAVRPEAGFTGKFTHGVGGLVGMIMEMGIAAPAQTISTATELWPTISGMIQYGVGAAALPALSTAIEAGQKVYEQTNDGMAAFNAAKANYLSTTGNVILPLHAGGGMAERTATSFTAGVATTELSRRYINQNLPEGMQSPYSFEDSLLNGLMMAGLGVMGPKANPGMAKTKEITDAATVIGEGKDTDTISAKLATTYAKTGIKPSQVVADAQIDQSIKVDLISPVAQGIEKPLLQDIKKMGGVSLDEIKDITGEAKVGRGIKGIPPAFFTNEGRGLDDLATMLKDKGYDIDTNSVDGGVEQLRGMIRETMDGTVNHVPMESQYAEFERMWAEHNQEYIPSDFELNANGLSEQDALDSAMVTRAAELDEAFVDNLAVKYENDGTAFMQNIKEFLHEKDQNTKTGGAGQKNITTQKTIEQQLIEAGRPAEEAKVVSVLPNEFINVLSGRMGITPDEFQYKYGPEIQSAMEAQGQDRLFQPEDQVKLLESKLGTTKADAQEWYKNGYRVDTETKDLYREAKPYLFQSDTWYSQLSKSIADAPDRIFNTGNQVSQWLNSNLSKLGVKKAEIEATGLDDWLKLQGKVTKADVQNFLEQNGVQVKDVTLGENVIEPVKNINEALDYIGKMEDMNYAEVRDEYGYKTDQEYIDLANNLAFQEGEKPQGATKFASYQLPGGENYKELLLTLPETPSKFDQSKVELKRVLRSTTQGSTEIWYDGKKIISYSDDPKLMDGQYKQRPDSYWMDAAKTLYERGNPNANVKRISDSADFRSAHFDQPNILAHVRFNERTDAEGKRVLFLEELQSDWGQKGKKEGFKESPDAKALLDRMDVVESERRALAEDRDPVTNMMRDEKLWHELSREHDKLTREYTAFVRAVPSAPFVTDTKAWTALSLKRMIRYAAENGFDKISWTTGTQQAARYDLSKHIDKINYRAVGDGKYHIVAAKNESAVWSDKTADLKTIEDTLGKDIAQKISDGEGSAVPGLKDAKSLSGLDLKVGGEGMKGYYDQIVPQVANDILKKLGGGKVEDVGLPVIAKDKGTGWESTDMQMTDFPATKQQGFTITPELRNKVMTDGMSLFQENKAFYHPDTRTIGLLNKADPSSAIHEFGHYFVDTYANIAKNADAPLVVKKDMNILLSELGIKDTPERTAIDQWHEMSLDQKRTYHEQAAQWFEQYLYTGKSPNAKLQPFFARMKEWLIGVYRDLKGLGTPISKEVSAVFDRMLSEEAAIKESDDTGIPRAYIPIAREMTVRSALLGTEKELNIAKVMENPYGTITSEKAPNHINYNYVDSPEDVKAVHARISEVFEKEIAASRGKESWSTTQSKAMEILRNQGIKAVGGDFQNLAAKGMAWEAMTQKAAFDVAEAARNIRAKGGEASPQDVKAQIVAIENLALLQAVDQGNGAEIARALAARKAAKQMSAMAKEINNLFAQYGHKPEELARMIGEIDTKEGMAKFAAGASKATTYEKVVEVVKAAWLSGPVTHLANIMGNTTFAVLRVPIDAIASGIGVLRGADVGERLSMYEPMARVAGLLEGTKNGLKIGAAMIKTEDAMVRKAESYRHAIEGKKGEIIRLPFRALGAEDAVFRAMNESAETFELSWRQAIMEGLNPSTREFRERTVEIMQNPTPEMLQEIFDAGERFTFNAELGKKGQLAQKFVREAHLEFVFPWTRTPGNIEKELIRMTPFAPVIKEWRDDLMAGGIRSDRAMAEILLGTGIMSVVFSYALNGEISGAGDPDPKKRAVAMAAGWQQYSIRIGDKWHSYQRLQPLGTLIGMAADIAEVWKHLDDNESDKIVKILSTAFANSVTNQTMLIGVTNIIRAFDEPERFAPRLFQQFAASLVPNIIAQPIAINDPFVREVNSIRDAVQSRILGLREKLLPKLDIWGEPIPSKERIGAVTPITVTTISKDKVKTEAARLEIGVAKAPKSIELQAMGQTDIGKVELTPEQQHQFTKTSGQFAHKILDPVVNSSGWDRMPDMLKKSVYDVAFKKGRELASKQAITPEQRVKEMNRISKEIIMRMQK